MRRHLLGIFGLLFLTAWIVLLVLPQADSSQWETFASICMRAGLVLIAIWLAFPQVLELLAKYPPWMIAAIVAGPLLIICYPRTILVIAPLLAVLALFHFIGWLFKPLPTNKSAEKKTENSSKGSSS